MGFWGVLNCIGLSSNEADVSESLGVGGGAGGAAAGGDASGRKLPTEPLLTLGCREGILKLRWAL